MIFPVGVCGYRSAFKPGEAIIQVMSLLARGYLFGTALAGAVALASGLSPWQSSDMIRFICYLLIASLASGLKVHLPGIKGTMSVNFFFVLVCVSTLSLSETLVIACAGTILQCVFRSKSKPKLVQ